MYGVDASCVWMANDASHPFTPGFIIRVPHSLRLPRLSCPGLQSS